MTNILISKAEKELLSKLHRSKIKEVWYDHVQCIEFILSNNEIVTLYSKSCQGKASYGGEEIISTEVRLVESFCKDNNKILIANDIVIDEIYQVNTCILFTDLIEMSNVKKQKLRESEDVLDKINSEASYENETLNYNPVLIKTDNEFVNYVEVGFLFRINGKYLSCFHMSNSFFFFIDTRDPFEDFIDVFYPDSFRLEKLY